MQIKLIKPACNRQIGTVLSTEKDINPDLARILLDKQYAIPHEVEVRSKAIGSSDVKLAKAKG